ncbi:hypothetical protein CHGG_08469 [Chaetomium globosum CBS 148.51]|uniref:Pheromone receptor n=1 Tax=Chaetomium globosum (strain ATCC 6205 / CBS 148.51 / DSM 1962 / NBRC 6347 / NRRL 1970) TaxID=306901 RepID=Q2GU85_CHAGB|nr:uncharacterized protein CHGG_08469 [Chaetomium globosum CBS 148.51]EAQ84455.1 hypothetical protein CHGG_08469 [Chaetomium globosum CBS 148.51]
MSNTTSPPPGLPPQAQAFNPLNQSAFLLYADGTNPIPSNTYSVTEIYLQATSLSILYGSQIGACFMMLAVVLGMTPRPRFRRLPTLISVAALALNTARMVLLAVFFTTSWVDLYVIVSQGASVVPRSDFSLSAAATVLSVPVTVLILAALTVQAWSMLRLWCPMYKIPARVLSLVLVLLTLAFNITTTVIQARAILYADISQIADWVRQAYLGLITASIYSFYFLFNIRLVMHMWVIFAALEFIQFDRFEPGSITQTSVIIVLPLGTLVVQRLANPAWFGTAAHTDSTSSSAAGGGGGSASANTTGTGRGSVLSRGGLSGVTATSVTSASRRPLLTSVRSNSRNAI